MSTSFDGDGLRSGLAPDTGLARFWVLPVQNSHHTPMPPLRAVALAALAALAAPAWATAPTDSTEAQETPSWARQMVEARRAVEAAEAAAPTAQAELADRALRLATALGVDAASERASRALVLRAQAVYEPHHGGVASRALSHGEVAELRAAALAQLDSNFGLPLEGPAVVAARRAEAERLAAAEAAEAERLEAAQVAEAAEAERLTAAEAAEALRAAGPEHLFYPADAAPLVERQRAIAARFTRTVRRGRSRLRAIERVMQRRGLPADLRFVAVIESALNPQAESWAGARGLWQFMPETAAEFGLDSLTVTDPDASTEAAARYLRQLRRMFRGDLQLALAAYNCGPGRVQRLVRQHRQRHGTYPTFWDLHDALPSETQAYVPRFIAVTELLGG